MSAVILISTHIWTQTEQGYYGHFEGTIFLAGYLG